MIGPPGTWTGKINRERHALLSADRRQFGSWKTDRRGLRFRWNVRPKVQSSYRPSRLSAGEGGNRVEFANAVDWKTSAAALKATFPLTASNPVATYNWDIGTIERASNDDKKFEVASHQWFDLTDKGGAYGVTVLSDCKNGSDKPDDTTLRLTLLYTPGLGEGNGRSYADQLTQDQGHHEFVYGLAGHAGDWRREQTDWQGQRLNQPLIAFQSSTHAGTLGNTTFSILNLSNSRTSV